MPQIIIRVVRRSRDYKAYVGKGPISLHWGCGVTPEVAIGDLVQRHLGLLGLESWANTLGVGSIEVSKLGEIVLARQAELGLDIEVSHTFDASVA